MQAVGGAGWCGGDQADEFAGDESCEVVAEFAGSCGDGGEFGGQFELDDDVVAVAGGVGDLAGEGVAERFAVTVTGGAERE